MRASTDRMIRCTVHWLDADGPRQQDLVFADRVIGDLLAVLVDTLGLPTTRSSYSLRAGPRAPQ